MVMVKVESSAFWEGVMLMGIFDLCLQGFLSSCLLYGF